MEKQRSTFLSYSRANKDFALRLARELKAEGFSVWLDQLDIPLGARWDVEVEKALEECEIFMIIMTPASISSENVRDEIGYAIDNGKRFLPVMLEKCTVPLRLRRFQYVDFTNKNFDDGVESAKELLRNLIAQTTIPRMVVSEEVQKQLVQAEEERLALAKADAEDLARQRAEEERLAKAQAKGKANEEADRFAAQKAEADSIATQKAKATPVGAKPVPTPTTQKKPTSKALVFGLAGVVALAMLGIVYGIVSNLVGPSVTETPVVFHSVTEVQPTNTVSASIPTSESTTAAVESNFFTINFFNSSDLSEFYDFAYGDDSKLSITPSNRALKFVLGNQDLTMHYIHQYVYENVIVRIRAKNIGQIENKQVSLICRYTGYTWYEFSVSMNGSWSFYDVSNDFEQIAYGVTNALKGADYNDYEMHCVGDSISVYINDQEVGTVKRGSYPRGKVGFSLATSDQFPLEVLVSEFEVSGP